MPDDVTLAGVKQDTLPERVRFRLSSTPIIGIVGSLCAGICCDRYSHFISYGGWLGLTLALLFVWWWLWIRRSNRLASMSVWLTWIAVGGATHHAVWSITAPNDILAYATDTASPVELTGVIATRPSIRPADSPETSILPPVDRTQCVVEVTTLKTGPATIPCSGSVQLVVRGHLAISNAGDTIRVRGRISRVQAPGNPGDFDFRSHLRRKGIHCIVRVGDPNAVETLAKVKASSFQWWRNRARYIASDILYSALDEDVYPIASAILLGDRDYVTRTIRSSFAQSGTMHLLAISGLHVGILALFIWRVARLVHVSLWMETVIVLGSLWAYAIITDIRPSVLRATVLATCLLGGRLWFRQTKLVNSLGFAALVVLLLNPTDLFDVGAQLSFVAVAAISWVNVNYPQSFDAGDLLQPWWERLWRNLLFVVKSDLRMMLAASIATAPLTAYSFNLYAPIGLTINVVLIHLVAVAMIAGYATLLAGYFAPFVVDLPAFLFSAGLRLLHRVAEFASTIRLGHRYGPGPGLILVLTIYIVFLLLITSRDRRRRYWVVMTLGTLVALGLGTGLRRGEPDQMRCTILDVGHGSCILVENPEGQTLLVDMGSMDSPLRASRAAQGCLWARGYACLDTLAITHADLDHFNGTIEFMKETTIGSIIAPESFVKSQEIGTIDIRNRARELGTPISSLQAGQPLRFGSIEITVLHPGVSATNEFEDDNASSLVLLIEFAGRRLLLTGDVSGTGQSKLLAKTIEPVDFLLAPHHGSKKDNREALAIWARPKVVVASSRSRNTKQLEDIYSEAKVYSTSRDGAVTITVQQTGSMTVEAYRQSLPDWFR